MGGPLVKFSTECFAKVPGPGPGGRPLEYNVSTGLLTEDTRQRVVDLVLHAADIGNPTFERELNLKWKDLVIQEFSEQAEAEEVLGLPVTQFMKVFRFNR